jgi:hypothetical protein
VCQDRRRDQRRSIADDQHIIHGGIAFERRALVVKATYA